MNIEQAVNSILFAVRGMADAEIDRKISSLSRLAGWTRLSASDRVLQDTCPPGGEGMTQWAQSLRGRWSP